MVLYLEGACAVCPISENNESGSYSLVQFADIIKHVLKCGIVDQDVDAAQSLQGDINYLLAIFFFAKIDSQAMAFTSSFLDSFFSLLCIFFFFGQIDDETRSSLHCKKYSNGTPDSRITTSDYGPFPV